MYVHNGHIKNASSIQIKDDIEGKQQLKFKCRGRSFVNQSV